MIDPMDATETANMEGQNNATSNGYMRPTLTVSEENKNGSSKPKDFSNDMKNDTKTCQDSIQISMPTESGTIFPSEWWKTGIALVYAASSLFLSTIMITVVHERVPPQEINPPLPDKFFDYIDHVEWAFSVTEINGFILFGLWIIQWLFLRHKSIVGRRFFFLVGTLHLYRCITIYVTTLPVPGMHIQCAPKLNGDSQAMVFRILRLMSGGGLSIAGLPVLCGDYLFSGHTLALVLTYLFIKEYSPPRFWWYQLVCWCMTAAGIICILLAREHYTIDVIVGYYITTRLFWWYHSMAIEKNLKTASQTSFLSRAWWYPVFNFFEKNVQGVVPCGFSWPISWSPSCFKSLCKRYSQVQKTREDNEKST